MCNGSSLSWVSISTVKQNFNCFLSFFPGVDAAFHEKKVIEMRTRLGPCGYHISNGNLFFFIEDTSAMKDES